MVSNVAEAKSRRNCNGKKAIPVKGVLLCGDDDKKGKIKFKDEAKHRQILKMTTINTKRKRVLSICTTNCKYDAVKRIAAQYGMKEVLEDKNWNLFWTDMSVGIERAKSLKRFQKINHFPGMIEICRKDCLARNLNRMLKLFPEDYNFFPKTWCFPTDFGDATKYSNNKRVKTYIIKPDTGSEGCGIYLKKSLKDVNRFDRVICQVYISRPYTIDGLKFDLRIYVLITSLNPLRIYVYNDGLVRFATSKYKSPTSQNMSNVYMHLCNYALQKHSEDFIAHDEFGSKRKIAFLNKWLRTQNVDVEELWKNIDEIIVKTVIAAYPTLNHCYNTCFPTHDMTNACFELLGFDVLLDWRLKPYLLEVNHSPSFHTDAQIDKDVKESLLMDTFKMLNLHQLDKRKIMEDDRKRARERLLRSLSVRNVSASDDCTGLKSEKSDATQCQFAWEDSHMGNFRKVYPGENSHKYHPFFKQSASTFQETAASRAREEASKLQREKFDLKLKAEQNKFLFGKWKDSKIGSESPLNFQRPKVQTKRSFKYALQNHLSAETGKKMSSFEPEIISEEDEKERKSSMAERVLFLKSQNIFEDVYNAMKLNGTLRGVDEKKYGELFEKREEGAENIAAQMSQCSCENVPGDEKI